MRPDVSRETADKLIAFENMVVSEATVQNLVSASTLDQFADRHVADSLQLARFIRLDQAVIDIGSGAGLPGVVLACLGYRVTLVEPRKLRADFLRRVVAELALPATVIASKAEQVAGQYDVITGRAVAALDRFLALTAHLGHAGSRWVLPKGRSAQLELAQARRNWQCRVESVASQTSPDASILLIDGLKPRRGA